MLYTDFEGQRICCISDLPDQGEKACYIWFAESSSAVHLKRGAWSWRFGVGGWPVGSKVLICPFCLIPWCRISFAPDDFHDPVAVQCDLAICQHSYKTHKFPGSLLDDNICGVDWGLLARLPEPLLRRECELTLKVFQ